MENIKQWKKVEQGGYDFFVNNEIVGRVTFHSSSKDCRAIFTIDDSIFYLKYPSIWNNNALILNQNEEVVMKVYNEKWYKSKLTVAYGELSYKLSIRNNPLAEYVLTDSYGKDCLSYGLKTDKGKVFTQIHTTTELHPIFDFLLFAHFYPIAMENCGDDFLMLSLLLMV